MSTMEVVTAYRIIRNFQDDGQKKVLSVLKEQFPEKTTKQIAELIVRVKNEIGATK